jgi:large subunit ribosomal protein L9
MQVILLERMDNLGNMGDIVNVKPGYARNYLLPRAKALRATKESLALFEKQKAQLEADNAKRKENALKDAKKVGGITANLIRQASEAGQLYGSVTARDIADVVSAKSGVKIDRTAVRMDRNYKTLGLFPIKIQLHAEVIETVTINIARSDEEAKVQLERGEALITTSDQGEKTAAAAAKAGKAKRASTEAVADDADEASAEAAA